MYELFYYAAIFSLLAFAALFVVLIVKLIKRQKVKNTLFLLLILFIATIAFILISEKIRISSMSPEEYQKYLIEQEEIAESKAAEKESKEAAKAAEKESKEAAKAAEKESKEAAKAAKNAVETEKSTESPSDLMEESENVDKSQNDKETNGGSSIIVPETTQSYDEPYSKLSDDQFKKLTGMIAGSFYNFSLDEAYYADLEKDSALQEALTEIYDYAYENYFELDPDYKIEFSKRGDVIQGIPEYDTLKKNFDLQYYRDSQKSKWVYTIDSYPLNKDDVIKSDDRYYIDAEGYINKGTDLYWIEDEVMQKAGSVVDVAYDKEIDGTKSAYAVKVKFIDEEPYWKDGEAMLHSNKLFTGKPLYYVDVLDPNRNICKELINFDSGIEWIKLKYTPLKEGLEVYTGNFSSKSYCFKIKGWDKASDILVVEYPSGTIEYKSYSAIINSENLYCIDK